MSKKIPHEIIDRASEWFIEMRETDISDSKREAFTEWLRSSPAHVQAYLEVAGLWGDASRVSADFSVELGSAPTNVIPLEGAGRVSKGFPVERTNAIAIAATFLLFLLVGLSGWLYQQRGVYYTDTGEQRVITLDDGSIVRLNSQSKVRVRLAPHERNIELLEGQAHFQVAKDTARPFNVHTHDTTVRAVGTQFDVYRRKTGTTVTVVEGRVALIRSATQQPTGSTEPPRPSSALPSGRSPSAGGTVLLAAGQQATITTTGVVQLEAQVNVAAATGWLQQELIFTGEPLSVVIDEFNRYTRRTIVLDDPTLAQFKINAAFNTTNPQSLLLFLSRMDGVEVNETESEIHITRREQQQ